MEHHDCRDGREILFRAKEKACRSIEPGRCQSRTACSETYFGTEYSKQSIVFIGYISCPILAKLRICLKCTLSVFKHIETKRIKKIASRMRLLHVVALESAFNLHP